MEAGECDEEALSQEIGLCKSLLPTHEPEVIEEALSQEIGQCGSSFFTNEPEGRLLARYF